MGSPQDQVKQFCDFLEIPSSSSEEDVNIALAGRIVSAIHDANPDPDLAKILENVKAHSCASYLEPLTVLPLMVASARSGVDELLKIMAQGCSAKEMVMAAEEAVESLERRLQDDDATDEEDSPKGASGLKQVHRILETYATAIPHLPRWKKSPGDVVKSLFSDLESLLNSARSTGTREEACETLRSLSTLLSTLAPGADSIAQATLHSLVDAAAAALAHRIDAGLSKKAFAVHFSRFVVPPRGDQPSGSNAGDPLEEVWGALGMIGVTTKTCESEPSISSLVLLAHHPTYAFSLSALTAFFPVILTCIQANTVLDEVLSTLLSGFGPLRAARTELPPDLIVPLSHLLPHLASSHPDDATRHYTFRILSLVLVLSPTPLRFRLLHELMTDKDLPPQLRVAAVGLLKEAVLEGLSDPKQNMFASPLLLSTFGPIILRPEPPDLFASGAELRREDFLDTSEPLRLVECLGLYYVLLMRDAGNRTGIRDKDQLRNVEGNLLGPLRSRIAAWDEESRGGGETDVRTGHAHGHGEDDAVMQLGILDMWLERTQSAIESMRSSHSI